VGPVPPLHPVDAYQLEIGLVDQSRRVEGMARPFTPELGVGDAAQLVVHHGHEAVEGVAATLGELPKKPGDVLGLTRVWRGSIRGNQPDLQWGYWIKLRLNPRRVNELPVGCLRMMSRSGPEWRLL
jgi:hypothetical protein